MRIKPVIKGILTFVPVLRDHLPERGTGGTNSAAYCYEVWMKHLTLLWESGMRRIPDTLAELGPGDSIGIGLAAMLSGVSNYYALDIVKYSNKKMNLLIFDELLELFQTRAARPSKGWPDYDMYLDKDLFPSHILSEDHLHASLARERIASIRDGIIHMNTRKSPITYIVPWSSSSCMQHNSVDVIISHSVLEHVADLAATYTALYQWLKPGGRMSHQIDFSSHGLSKAWNGHWACSELLWKVIAGNRPFLINRQPISTHVDLMKDNGFQILSVMKYDRNDGIVKSQFSTRWKEISESDSMCSSALIQAKK
jgi:hypothetical protein